MAEAQEIYQRLPGKGRRREKVMGGAVCTLWLGADHILQAENLYFHEDYKRFYYRDIQAFILRRTNRYIVWNVVWTVLLALLLLPAVTVAWYWWFLGLFGLVPLWINLAQGPSCLCYIRTAVQQEELPSLCRIKQAKRAIRLIRVRINQAQGEITPEALTAAAATPPVDLPAPRNQPAPEPLRHEAGAFHWGAFSAVMANALCGAIGLDFKGPLVPTLCVGLLLTSFMLALIAGIKQRRSDIPTLAQRLIWGTLIFVALLMFGMLQGGAVMEGLERARTQIRTGINMPNHSNILTFCLQILGNPIVNGIQTTVCLFLAIPGLISLSLRVKAADQPALQAQPASAPVASNPAAPAFGETQSADAKEQFQNQSAESTISTQGGGWPG